jgi:hypothetical protein
MGTLYTPPPKPLVSKRTIRVVMVLLVLAGLGGYLYLHPPAWLRWTGTAFQGCGHPMITVNVTTTPTRADVLLDGERMTELPLHVRQDGAIHRVTAIAPGYEPADVAFKADENKNLILTLRPPKRR